MFISDFDYPLPEGLIAQYPAPERRASRLLEVSDSLYDRQFTDLPGLLRPGDLLVFNDTRVIRARLQAHKGTGGRAEVLIERVQAKNVALAHVRASKSPKPGSKLLFDG
jgi:S-adenosylmethionine:tRNA ribosyltransferase-isomerase